MRKIRSLIIIAFFVMTVFLPFVKVDSESAIVDNPLMDSQAVMEPTTPIETTSDDWFERESVLSDIEFNKQPINYDSITNYENIYSKTFSMRETGRGYIYDNDGQNYFISFYYDSTQSTLVMTSYFDIYCGGSGTFTYETKLLVNDGSDYYSAIATGTISVTSGMLDNLGYLHMYFTAAVGTGAGTSIHFKLWYFNVGSGWSSIEVFHMQEVGSPSYGVIDYMAILSDQLYFTQTTIENQIRSEYQYASDTIITHKLTIPSVPHAKEINVYAPTHWTYSSTNPTATVTTVSSDHTITSPTELTYEMLFISNSTYLLAIEDVSTDYLVDVGFEKGTKDDLVFVANFNLNDEIRTTISSEGYHSYYLEDDDAADDVFSFALGEIGSFYISFDYYLVSSTYDELRIYTRDASDNWVYQTVTLGDTDRWHKEFLFVELLEVDEANDNRDLVFHWENGDGELYFDNFRIFKTSTEIDTVDVDEYEISSTFISWDGYSNPSASVWEYNLTLIDRTAQTTVASVNTSDLSYEYSASLVQKEYEVFIDAYSTDDTDFSNSSWYFTPSYPYNIEIADDGNYIDFSEYSVDNDQSTRDSSSVYREQAGTVNVTNGYLTYLKDTTAVNTYTIYDFSETVNPSIYTYGMVRIWCNESDHHISIRFYDGDSYELVDTGHTIADTWVVVGVLLSNDVDWSGFTGLALGVMIYEADLVQKSAMELRIDYIRLVHVEEETSFATDTALYLRSENYLWTDAVYYDSYYIGNYDEMQLIGLSGEVGDHNITWVPFDRQNEVKAYIYSDTHSHIYSVSAGTNYLTSMRISIDAAAGLLYTTITTSWGNQTVRVKDNSTWLGSAQNEGNSIWSFDQADYGLHNFSIVVYNGGDTWATIYTSVTIVEPESEELAINLYEKNFDADSSQIYINYQTTWGNTTVRVMDNSTWLGGAVSGEDLSIWSTTSAYGLHNITVIIYDDGVEWFTDTFSFTIVEPSVESNYFRVISVSIDASAGLLYTFIHTYWENCTVRVKDNSTWLGSDQPEGNTIWSFDETSYGLHNFSIVVSQGGVEWATIYASVTIVEPDAEVLALNHYTVQFDADAGHVYLNYESNWANTTCRVMDNSSWLSTATGEGISIWTFITDIGLHNITIFIYDDGVEWFTDVFSFTITLPEQIWQEVLFTFSSSYDSQMIDPNEYLQIFLNDALVSAGASTYLSSFNLSIYDNFNQLLYNYTNYAYAATIDLQLPLRNATFYNPNSISCEYQLWYGTEFVQILIGPTTYFSYYMLDNNYTIIAIPTALDAGNGYEYVVTAISFEVAVGMGNIEVTLDTQQIVIIYRPITISATSQYTGASISEHYLQYYLNGILSMEGASTETANLTIQLAVTDVFGNVLYNNSVVYSRYISITVPLRQCTFTNKELVSTTLTITQSGSEEHLFFVLGGSASIPVYLADNTYTVIHAPISPDKEEGVLWQPKDYDFTCSLSSQSLDMWLDTFDNVPPLFDEFGGNILDWLTNNRWMTLAGIGIGALNLIGLVFAVGVIITRLPKREEKGFDSK